MNKKIKTLLLSGLISLGMLGANVNNADAMSYMYTSANVNMRQYAGTYSKKLGTLPKGTKLTIYGSYGNWYSVYVNNKWGYVCKDYVVGNRYSQSSSYNNSTSNKKPIVNTNQGQVLKKLVIINKDSRKVAYYENGYLVKSMPCAIGKPSTPTPSGSFTVLNKEKNRPYYKDNISGGADNNPLGSRFIQYTWSGHALHGTCYPNTVGLAVSDGCNRMREYDVQWLYNKVGVGTHIVIGNGYNKDIASKYGYKIY